MLQGSEAANAARLSVAVAARNTGGGRNCQLFLSTLHGHHKLPHTKYTPRTHLPYTSAQTKDNAAGPMQLLSAPCRLVLITRDFVSWREWKGKVAACERSQESVYIFEKKIMMRVVVGGGVQLQAGLHPLLTAKSLFLFASLQHRTLAETIFLPVPILTPETKPKRK
ncbi:hypothetical protein C0Q70_17711 [Pomacea canaliculata]|uniref:Uncharacterized protein n=1 Tax=Pomacea canaliculata TaxID=400727 RepID=A0A2T7NL63_POMCA|nr:hypothetical protein C0Q70_17711 [Pomacea canaliculata]